MKKSEKITIDDLAGMVNNGFTELRTDMNQRFDQMDERFDKLEFKAGSHENRISNLEDKVQILSKKTGLNK